MFRISCRGGLGTTGQPATTFLDAEELAEIEKQVITAAIDHHGSKRVAAEVLGVSPRTLTNKLKLYSSEDSRLSEDTSINKRAA